MSLVLPLVLFAQTVTTPPPIIRRRDSETVSDDDACSLLRTIAAKVQPDLPIQADAITRTTGMAVVCGLRTVTVNKVITVDPTSFRAGWQGREQLKWNAIICRNDAFAPLQRRGWRFALQITFLSGERFGVDADCSVRAE